MKHRVLWKIKGMRREIHAQIGDAAPQKQCTDNAFSEAPFLPDWSRDPGHDLELAIAEISARQQALYRDAMPPVQPAPDLSRFENQLENITEQIKQLNAGGAFRETASNLRRGLKKVGKLHQRLKALPPAEELAEFSASVRDLSQKIDRIPAIRHDPHVLQQLEGTIIALRGVISHVASNDALEAVSKEVRALAARIDRLDRDLPDVLIRTWRDHASGAKPVSETAPQSLENMQQTLDAIVDRLNVIEINTASAIPAMNAAKESVAEESAEISVSLPDPVVFDPPQALREVFLPSFAEEKSAPLLAQEHREMPSFDPAETTDNGPVPVDFIAAARRAAQAAEPALAEKRAIPASPRKKTKTRGRKIRNFLIASILILIAAASIHVGLTLRSMFSLDNLDIVFTDPPAGFDAQILTDEATAGEDEDDTQANDDTTPSEEHTGSIGGSGNSGGTGSIGNADPVDDFSRVPPAGVLPLTYDPHNAARGYELFGSLTGGRIAKSRTEALSMSAPMAPTLREAARGGDARAAYELGIRYLDGRDVSADAIEAAHWLAIAAKADLAPAQFRLGSLYESGKGVAKSLATAAGLYLSAAQRGNAMAMHNLAVLNANGIDGKRDYKIAAHWFRKAAEYGIVDSQYNLGILSARGLGLKQDPAEAYLWFALAAAQGDRDSIRLAREIAARLDETTLERARRAVQSFTAKTQPRDAIAVQPSEDGRDQADPTSRAERRSPKSVRHAATGPA